MTLKLGVPSKGRLMEKTFQWFAARGITLRKSGSDREYAGAVEGIDGIELVLLSAGEIPRELDSGQIHLGVTGSDLVREKLSTWDRRVVDVAKMGFGGADLIIAVPQAWIDVDTLDDLDAAAAAFRAHHGFRLRIATKYHRLVRDFLRENGVADYQLIDSQGATEGTIRNETAEAIARLKIAPPLERAFQGRHNADQFRVEHNGAASDPIRPDIFVQSINALAAQQRSFDDPIDTSSGQQFGLALGPHTRDVARQSVRRLGAFGILPCREVCYTFGSDGQFL